MSACLASTTAKRIEASATTRLEAVRARVWLDFFGQQMRSSRANHDVAVSSSGVLAVLPGQALFTLSGSPPAQWLHTGTPPCTSYLNASQCPPGSTHCLLLLLPATERGNEQVSGTCFDSDSPADWVPPPHTHIACPPTPAGDADWQSNERTAMLLGPLLPAPALCHGARHPWTSGGG
eukprot:3748373-Rhodomonas_salina.1